MSETDLDSVFRALAEPSRRTILDLLRARPGLTVNDVSAEFEVTRFAVMKHLRVLGEAGLVESRRDGRRKRLYLNAVPIRMIHDRWLSQYGAFFASRMTALKYQLEGDSMPDKSLRHLYVVYIQTTPEKLWQALTDPVMTEQYFHGSAVDSTFREGADIRYTISKDGKEMNAIEGKILEVDPPRRLVHSFIFPSNGDVSRVTWELEPMGDVVKLTLLHDEWEGETDTYKGVEMGWTPVLSGLKTLLETGKRLPVPAM